MHPIILIILVVWTIFGPAIYGECGNRTSGIIFGGPLAWISSILLIIIGIITEKDTILGSIIAIILAFIAVPCLILLEIIADLYKIPTTKTK